MASTFLSTTLGTPTSSRIWTFSTWLKRGGLSSTQHIFSIDSGSNRDAFSFDSDNGLRLYFNGSATGYADLSTNRVLRDTSAFYHLVIAVDTTQATAANRVKLYINGTQYTWDETTVYGDQNYDTFNASGNTFRIGRDRTAANYFDGILTHTHFVDGTQYAASTFGETDSTSGIWKPKTAPSVTYGNNGFFLKFENSGNLDLDSSGNSRSFTTSGTLTQNVDTPTNNYATLNPLARDHSDTTSLTNGNLTHSLSNYSLNARSTLAMTAGKWYWEFKQSAVNNRAGMCTSGFNPNLDTDDTNAYSGHATGRGGVYNMNTGAGTSWQRTNNDTSKNVDTPSGTALASGANDIISCAMDVGTGKFHVAVNGTWLNSGNPATGANPQITLTNSSGDPLHVFSGFNTSNAMTTHFNFGSGYFGTTAVASANADGNGHGAFEYAVPSGFYALNTKNIKEFG